MKLTGVKVVCYEVVITLPDGVDKAKCEGGQDVEETWVGEVDLRLIHTTISKEAARNLVENVGKSWAGLINGDGMVHMLVAKVFDGRSKMAKEDYIS